MSYEDLDVWKRAVKLSVEIYASTRELRDYGFRDQLTRSSLSVASNIAEGFERGSDNEVARFLTIAKGSAGEMRTQVMIGQQIGYISQSEAEIWADESLQLGRMLGTLIRKYRG